MRENKIIKKYIKHRHLLIISIHFSNILALLVTIKRGGKRAHVDYIVHSSHILKEIGGWEVVTGETVAI